MTKQIISYDRDIKHDRYFKLISFKGKKMKRFKYIKV